METVEEEKKKITAGEDIEAPPFFKSWAGMYWLVLGNLAFLIVLFYLLTKIYE